MKSVRLFSVLMTVGLLTAAADAAVQRTFVSAGSGNDLNPCSRTAPCRNFAAAIAQTLPNGDVVVLDSGGYGSVTITQGVSLEAPSGVLAAITVLAGDGITINAPGPDRVIIRGITISGLGGNDGIHFVNGGPLSIEGAFVMHAQAAGLTFPNPGYLFLKDSTFIGNIGGGVAIGGNASGVSYGVLEHCRIEGNQQDAALAVESNSRVTLRDSIAAGSTYGVYVHNANLNQDARVMVEDSLVTANAFGLYATNVNIFSRLQTDAVATPIAFIRVSNSTIVHNQTGVSGTIISRANNTLNDNTTDGSFTATYVPQ